MNSIANIRDLLHTAKQIAGEEFDAPTTEAILAVFYRLCIEHDLGIERGEDYEVSVDRDSVH